MSRTYDLKRRLHAGRCSRSRTDERRLRASSHGTADPRSQATFVARVKAALIASVEYGKIWFANLGIASMIASAGSGKSHQTSLPIFSPGFFMSRTRTRLPSLSRSAHVIRVISSCRLRRKDRKGDDAMHQGQRRGDGSSDQENAPSTCRARPASAVGRGGGSSASSPSFFATIIALRIARSSSG